MPDLTPPSRPYVGRFAPSPTGPLHWGSALAAVGSWLHARHYGGRWLVRVEDLDPPREQAGAAQRQLDTLASWGLEPDGEVLWQSRRHDLYREALDALLASGDAFPCRCSRAELEASNGIHRGCVATGPVPGRTRSFRLRVDDTVIGFDDPVHGYFRQQLRREVGDVVLRRADGFWAYQLAVVVDDAAQGVTHVVRGADLLDSTPRQIALQRALGLPTPRYLHLPLWLGPDGRKLSKSEGAGAASESAPMQVLETCWRALGQPASAWPGGAQPGAALAAAARGFDPALIPAELTPCGLRPGDAAHTSERMPAD